MKISHLSRLTLAATFFCAAHAFAVDAAEDLIKKGDVYDVKLQPAKALDYYLVAEKQTPQDVRLLCRIARQYRHMIPDTSSKEEKLRLGEQALSYARRAAAVAPNDAEANLSIAISCGKILPFESSKEQINGSRQIRQSVDKAIALDPRNDLAWHVLGRWHQVLADVSGVKRALGSFLFGKLPPAKNEDAVACFQKAIALNPSRPMHYIELGRTYAHMGRVADARKFIEKGLSLPNTEKDDQEIKERGRETLAKLG